MSTTAPAPDTGTRLAAERTRLAHERTLMAWVRTATALISFGFTIYKFFEFEDGRALPKTDALLSPRVFGLLMIGTGLIALLFSIMEHRHNLRRMEAEFGSSRRSVAALVGLVVAVTGLLAFGAALFRG